jgi:hypothetical protein
MGDRARLTISMHTDRQEVTCLEFKVICGGSLILLDALDEQPEMARIKLQRLLFTDW